MFQFFFSKAECHTCYLHLFYQQICGGYGSKLWEFLQTDFIVVCIHMYDNDTLCILIAFSLLFLEWIEIWVDFYFIPNQRGILHMISSLWFVIYYTWYSDYSLLFHPIFFSFSFSVFVFFMGFFFSIDHSRNFSMR